METPTMTKPKQVHFMLDLETLDTAPTAHVLSAALVMFDPITGEVLGPPRDIEYTFLFNAVREIFNTKRSIVFGLAHQNGSTISAKTLAWWNKQNKAYFDTLIKDDETNWSLQEFLIDFSRTMTHLTKVDECDVHIWCTSLKMLRSDMGLNGNSHTGQAKTSVLHAKLLRHSTC